jgi:hypothetical protein
MFFQQWTNWIYSKIHGCHMKQIVFKYLHCTPPHLVRKTPVPNSSRNLSSRRLSLGALSRARESLSPELRRERKGEESRELVRDSGGVDAGEESQDSALQQRRFKQMATESNHVLRAVYGIL